MGEQFDVIVVGAGQAGLAVSHELTAAGVAHVVLERARVGQSWRDRWKSFCLVTPNWSVRLPGGAYDGPDPDGYMPRDEIVSYLERYAATFAAPVREGIEVLAVERGTRDDLVLRTPQAAIRARSVVLASGAYQRPHRPAFAGLLPPGLLAIDAEEYREPSALPRGSVLVVGSGQTGCQLAEELQQSGRDVFLACGRAPWLPRRIGERDMFSWIVDSGFLDAPASSLPSPQARLLGNVQATGRDGGHDLHYRTLQAAGVNLVGRLVGVDGTRARFAPDLAESVAFGDARYGELCDLIRRTCADRGLPAPSLPAPAPFDARPRDAVDLGGFGAVIFTSGFRPSYRSWVRAEEAFDDLGFPIQADGASTAVPGLYFCGVHFQRRRKSALLFGVGEDAAIVAGAIAARQR